MAGKPYLLQMDKETYTLYIHAKVETCTSKMTTAYMFLDIYVFTSA